MSFHFIFLQVVVFAALSLIDCRYNYDRDCGNPVHNSFYKSRNHIVFAIDSSTEFEKYRIAFATDFLNIVTDTDKQYRQHPAISRGFWKAAGTVRNGCFTPGYPTDQVFVWPEKYDEAKEMGEKLLSTKSQEGGLGMENFLASVGGLFWYNSTERGIISDKECIDRTTSIFYSKSCEYLTLVYISGSNARKHSTNPECQAGDVSVADSEEAKGLLFTAATRIVGVFPTTAVAEEHANFFKTLEVPFCVHSFDKNVSKLKNISIMISDCTKKDADTRVKHQPCFWIDPVGYNTLGL